MVRYMYDSVNPAAIPRDAEMVAGYTDGIYRWSQADWDRFPNAVKVRISAIGVDTTAHVVDVEPGCVWPPENAVPWVVEARRSGVEHPTVYTNYRNDLWRTRQAFDRAGVPQPHYWVAEYTGWPRDGSVPYIPDGTVGRQFAHPPQLNNQHYDLSVIRDYWPGVDKPREEDDMPYTEQQLKAIVREAVFTKEITRSSDPGEPVVGGTLLVEWFFAAADAHYQALIGIVKEISKRIDSIAVGGIDEDALADRLAARLAKRLES